MAFGLNEERANNAAVLYTTATGTSTRTSDGGLELILERGGREPWLPLQADEIMPVKSSDNNSGNPRSPAGRCALHWP